MRSSPYCCARAGQVSLIHGDGSARGGLLSSEPEPEPNANPNPNPNLNQVRGELTLVLAPLGAEARGAQAARQLSLTEQVDAALRARLAAGEPSRAQPSRWPSARRAKKAVYARALNIQG